MDISIVGAGRVGTAVAMLWRRAGHRIVAVSGGRATAERAGRHLPGVPVLDDAEAARAAELVVIGVPDDLIAATVQQLVDRGALSSGWVAHLSGATPLSALDAARGAGARRLGIHPLQTFPDVEAAVERIPGCVVALGADDDEGAALAEQLAKDLGGRPFRLPEERRAIYHAAAVFASNYLVAATGVAEVLLEVAGVRRPDAAAAGDPREHRSIRSGRGAHRTGRSRRRRHDRAEPAGVGRLGAVGGRRVRGDGTRRARPGRA
jgi:predicted short-subunit dehydrogenase-like oxidoreductase (DUF2520 family)